MADKSNNKEGNALLKNIVSQLQQLKKLIGIQHTDGEIIQ